MTDSLQFECDISRLPNLSMLIINQANTVKPLGELQNQIDAAISYLLLARPQTQLYDSDLVFGKPASTYHANSTSTYYDSYPSDGFTSFLNVGGFAPEKFSFTVFQQSSTFHYHELTNNYFIIGSKYCKSKSNRNTYFENYIQFLYYINISLETKECATNGVVIMLLMSLKLGTLNCIIETLTCDWHQVIFVAEILLMILFWFIKNLQST